MRGEKGIAELKVNGKRVPATAIIVDENGNVVYRVVSTGWTKLVIWLMVVMMGICTLVSIMVWVNAQKINKLEEINSESVTGPK